MCVSKIIDCINVTKKGSREREKERKKKVGSTSTPTTTTDVVAHIAMPLNLGHEKVKGKGREGRKAVERTILLYVCVCVLV
jgi:hypothetical protein